MPTLGNYQLLAMLDKELQDDPQLQTVARKIYGVENYGKSDASTDTESSAGAQGVMQVMPKTRDSLIKQGFLQQGLDYSTPEAQVKAGAAALRELKSRGITKPDELAVGYNASPAVLQAYREGKPIPAETTDYLRKFGAAPVATTTRTSTNTTGRDIPEDLKQEMLDGSKQVSLVSKQMQSQLEDLGNQISGASSDAQDAIRRVGEGEVAKSQANADITLENNANANRIASTLGINLNDQGDTPIRRDLQITNAAQAARVPIQAELTRLQSTSMLDDPIGWFMNNVKAIPLESKVQAIQAEETNAWNNINTRQNAANKQQTVQPVEVDTAIRQKALAEAMVARARADQEIAQHKIPALGAMANILQERLGMMNADQSQRNQVYRLIFDTQVLKEGMSASDKADAKAVDDLKGLNGAIKSYDPGAKDITPTEIHLLKPEMKDRLVRLAMTGQGRDLAETVSTLNEFNLIPGMVKNFPQKAEIIKNAAIQGQKELDAASQLYSGAERYKMPPELAMAKNDADRLQWGIKQWQEKITKELKANDMGAVSAENPFKLQIGLASDIPALTNNSVTKFVKSYAEKFKETPITEKLIYNDAAARVAGGEPHDKVAADLVAFWKTGLQAQYLSQGLSGLGLPVPNTYKSRVGTGLFNNAPTDMTNITDVDKKLIQTAVSDSLRMPISAWGPF